MDTQISMETVPTGFMEVNTYILRRGGEAVVIDPGGGAHKILKRLGDATLAAVLLTHSHFDHIGAVDELLDAAPGAELLCHPRCAERIASPRDNLSEMLGAPFSVRHAARALEGGAETAPAGIPLRTFFVPGHTPDHLCFYQPGNGWLFSGDTVFAGSVGRSDFPGGDGELLIRGIREMLAAVPPETQVLPGHGPASTAGGELQGNPYL